MKTRELNAQESATQEGGCCSTTTASTTQADPCCEQPTDGTSCCDKTESKEVNSEKVGCC